MQLMEARRGGHEVSESARTKRLIEAKIRAAMVSIGAMEQCDFCGRVVPFSEIGSHGGRFVCGDCQKVTKV